MTYIDRYTGGYETAQSLFIKRRDAVVSAVRKMCPADIEERLRTEDGPEPVVELDWIEVPDPRYTGETPGSLLVKPVLYYGEQDYCGLRLIGRTPSGEDRLLGDMPMAGGYEPALAMAVENDYMVGVPWNSADAGIFISLAESVLAIRPS